MIDTKTGFVTALNLGLIAAPWSGSTLSDKDVPTITECAGGTATLIAIVSTLLAPWAVLSKERLERIFSKGSD